MANYSIHILSTGGAGQYRGAPAFFLACCHEAKHGGKNGYANAGWHLANSIGTAVPDDLDLDDWSTEVDNLHELFKAGDDEGIWAWWARHYPDAMKLIPARRREQFIKGVHRAYEENRVWA
jgi:hypothetical protein